MRVRRPVQRHVCVRMGALLLGTQPFIHSFIQHSLIGGPAVCQVFASVFAYRTTLWIEDGGTTRRSVRAHVGVLMGVVSRAGITRGF